MREIERSKGILFTIGTVESATGGRISDKLTDVPGSSDYFKGSVIAYSNDIKNSVVGVREETLSAMGAVSADTAIEMAESGRKLLGVDICISDTGIAGPTGATREKPVGLFYIGLSAEDAATYKKYVFKGDRNRNKQKAVETALSLLEDYLVNKLQSKFTETKRVVTCFIKNNCNILILKRSPKVGTYQGKWSGVSGYLEHEALEQAYIEISEETGLRSTDIKLLKKGLPLELFDKKINTKWIVYPFLFSTEAPEKIQIDWENLETRWIQPEEIGNFETVPGLKEALDKVI